jgi:hypothetical protein
VRRAAVDALAVEAPWLISSPLVRLGFDGRVVSDIGPLPSWEAAKDRARAELVNRCGSVLIREEDYNVDDFRPFPVNVVTGCLCRPEDFEEQSGPTTEALDGMSF